MSVSSLVFLSGLIVSGAASRCAVTLAERTKSWRDRRLLLLASLWIPAVLIGILLAGAVAMLLAGCPWFKSYDRAVLGLTGIALLALLSASAILGSLRSTRIRQNLDRCSRPIEVGPWSEIVSRLSAALELEPPRLRYIDTQNAVACTYGIRHPTVLLSSGFICCLDDQELEAVIAHELAHLRNRDHRVAGLAAWLRDAFFFLPTGPQAWAILIRDRELACDELCAQLTGRPGALASALYKVAVTWRPDGWQAESIMGLSCAHSSDLEERLGALVARKSPPKRQERPALAIWMAGGGFAAILLALAPFWYAPLCMKVLCLLR